MPKLPIALAVPEPCSEPWDNMSPVSGGRRCASCRKTVVDFTVMSDAAIRAYVQRHGFGSCGRFREDQLLRSLSPGLQPFKPRSLAGVAASALLILSLATAATAQPPAPARPPIAQSATPETPAADDSLVANITGVLYDLRNTPVVNAHVELRYNGTTISRELTDFDGQFQLSPTTALPRGSRCQLVASYQGADTTQDIVIQEEVPPVRLSIGPSPVRAPAAHRTGYIVPLMDPKPATMHHKHR